MEILELFLDEVNFDLTAVCWETSEDNVMLRLLLGKVTLSLSRVRCEFSKKIQREKKVTLDLTALCCKISKELILRLLLEEVILGLTVADLSGLRLVMVKVVCYCYCCWLWASSATVASTPASFSL